MFKDSVVRGYGGRDAHPTLNVAGLTIVGVIPESGTHYLADSESTPDGKVRATTQVSIDRR
jgi:hypothetical protein